MLQHRVVRQNTLREGSPGIHPYPCAGYERQHMLVHAMRVPTVWREKWSLEPLGISLVVPYLGKRMVEFAFSVPDELRYGFSPRKPLHRRAFEDSLPQSVIHGRETINDVRIQQSFSARRTVIEDLSRNSRLVELGYANRQEIDAITCAHGGTAEY